MSTLTIQSNELFESAYAQIANYQVAAGMTELVLGLQEMRRQNSAETWREFAQSDCLAHPITSLLHLDPMTRRAFEKPRGYAGDAELLDYIYGIRPLPADTPCLGAAVYGYALQAPAPSAVRARRDILAARIDVLAAEIERPRILAVACGHLREAQKSDAVAEGRVGDFFALDQDRMSLALVEREQSAQGVKPVHGSVKSILKGETVFSDLDFAYSTGLYDYLPQPVAIKLTNRLFGMLKPGGRLLLANFLPDVMSLGYMETFMGWPLIYRTDEEMADVASGLPVEQVAKAEVFRDPHENVVFVEVVKQ
jgi:extracellular factor (EF) 3-hydroxypalmitic acid methyl ester biosynthesis protein